MRYWETPTFKALQDAWYQHLEDEGFLDAEEMIAGEMVLKQNAEHPYCKYPMTAIEAKETYFRLLRSLVQSVEFDSEIDRVIMAMVAEGAKQRDITAELNGMGIRHPPRFRSEFHRNREVIRRTVRKYELRWGMRKESA